MANSKVFTLIIALLIAMSLVSAVRYEIDNKELILTFNNEELKTGIITIETDTEPLLISAKGSGDIKKFIDISPKRDLKVTKGEPLVLTIKAMNPQETINGFIVIDSLYQTPPEDINYLNDDTITIPVTLKDSGASTNKITIKLTETLLPGEESAIPLATDAALPLIIIILLIFIFKRKWSKASNNEKKS